MATSVSGRPDDLAWCCSSDTFDLNGRAFESSENWAVLSTDGDKPSPRFDVINHLIDVLKCIGSCDVFIIIGFYTEASITHSSGYHFKQHAAAMVGSKMIVFGGDSGNHLLDDTKVLMLFF